MNRMVNHKNSLNNGASDNILDAGNKLPTGQFTAAKPSLTVYQKYDKDNPVPNTISNERNNISTSKGGRASRTIKGGNINN